MRRSQELLRHAERILEESRALRQDSARVRDERLLLSLESELAAVRRKLIEAMTRSRNRR